LLDASSDIILVQGLTPDGIPGPFIEANAAASEILGFPRSRLLAITLMDIDEALSPAMSLGYSRTDGAPVDDRRIRENQFIAARKFAAQVMDKGDVTTDTVWITASGAKIPVRVRSRKTHLNGQPAIAALARDVSGDIALRQKIEDSERRFLDIFTHSTIGEASYAGDRRMMDVNVAALRILGIPDKVEFERFNPFDNPFVPDSVRRMLAGGETVRYEAEIDFTEVSEQKLFVSSRRGKAYCDIIINALGRDKDFQLKGYLIQIVDNTKRRESELALRQIERQLHQAHKMEAIGTLAGGIAHDFNNILTPIIGYAEMAQYIAKGNEALLQYMKEVVKASHRAKDLVNQILAFSRQKDSEGRPIRIRSIVKEVAKLQQSSLPENIQLNVLIKTEHDIVIADPTQIHQLLMNLITNALHAMKEKGGLLELRLTDFLHFDRPGSEMAELAPGRYLRLSVKDSGTGIPSSVIHRIFEPFFTTKERGEGTGMGLAVVHGIVTSLKGTVKVETDEDKGSTFHVMLPAVKEDEIAPEDISEALPSGSGQVLFVDDDTEIVKMVEQMLSSLGYKPVVAQQGTAAFRLFQLQPDDYCLVITDMVMPGIGGKDLAREIHALRPATPIILCTGFSEIPGPEEMHALGICDLLMKPIIMRDMAQKIQQALNLKQP
jgi:signal transduction histidine kinase/ActR/RegA family two-component response regulator